MAKIKLNERTIDCVEGSLVIDLATDAGVFVPHFCYHRALGNPGQCRMCLVEVKGMAKLQPACRLRVAEGMVVRTDSPAVLAAQSGALELHLVNHPLDCPVCDQAGECGLQDCYMQVGRYKSSVGEDKRHFEKAKPLGPHVMLDQERCISCTRCARFLANVTKTSELGMFGRGPGQAVGLAPGRTLDNPYSGNLPDVCPVGALTDREFRFQARVWYLTRKDSICAGCSRGCAISVHVCGRRWHNGGRRVARFKPRLNPEVNGYWMCDEGRYSYERLDAGRLGRVLALRPRKDLSWDAAFAGVTDRVASLGDRKGSAGLAVLASGALSNEDWRSFKRLFVDSWRAGHFVFGPEPDQVGEEDSLLRRREKTANLKGGEALGFGDQVKSTAWEALRRALEAGKVWGLYIVDRDPLRVWGPEARALLARLDLLVYQGPFAGPSADLAHYRLPATAWLEEEGSFTNCDGRVQRYDRALEPIGQALPDWRIFEGLLDRRRSGEGEA